MQLETFLLPSHWASAFINGDLTGYDSDDLEAIRLFTKSMVDEHGRCWCINVDEDSNFTRWHDAVAYDVLACDCGNFTFDVVN